MCEMKGPIGRAIDGWQKRQTTRLSMPGHKGNDKILPALSRFRDITELPEFDNLHAPQACILRSEQQIADIYKVKKSYFLVNGASGGLKASLLSLGDSAKTLRIPRNAHRSIWQGCLLAGIEPVYIQPDLSQGIILPPSIESYQRKSADATLILTTSYEGAVIDYSELAGDGILIADEAHGSHLSFGNIKSAISYADITVHGTHKTLGSLTQSGLLHSNNKIPQDRLLESLSMMESTSPSWLLLSSVEEAVIVWDQMKRHGELQRLWERCACLRARINRIPGFRIPEGIKDVQWDPLHLCIQTEDGLNGGRLLNILETEFAVDLEMSTDGYIVGILGPFDNPETDEQLLHALEELSRKMELKDQFGKREQLYWPQPEQVIGLKQAYDAKKRQVNLAAAAGCIAATPVSAYPPGIPLLLPGEKISQELCEILMNWQKQGVWIEGLADGKIKVIED
ncbi:hypothetical protein JR334_09305 [Clostridia bacterium]|nr:hypothetical protein JR334_09305 [Clostridia bacterium]